MARPVVLNIPHSSRHIPLEWRARILLDDAGLSLGLLRMTDLHTERLFDVGGAARAVFPVSRLIVDPGRFADDSLEPMAERGMGVIYTRTSGGLLLRHEPGSGDRGALLDGFYQPHHRNLAALAGVTLAANGSCLIVDCHSFPSLALPYERQPEGAPRPEICIGTDSFHTPDSLRSGLMEFFLSRGYRQGNRMKFQE
jgi:N-formylglutamate amidohydrolase